MKQKRRISLKKFLVVDFYYSILRQGLEDFDFCN